MFAAFHKALDVGFLPRLPLFPHTHSVAALIEWNSADETEPQSKHKPPASCRLEMSHNPAGGGSTPQGDRRHYDKPVPMVSDCSQFQRQKYQSRKPQYRHLSLKPADGEFGLCLPFFFATTSDSKHAELWIAAVSLLLQNFGAVAVSTVVFRKLAALPLTPAANWY